MPFFDLPQSPALPFIKGLLIFTLESAYQGEFDFDFIIDDNLSHHGNALTALRKAQQIALLRYTSPSARQKFDNALHELLPCYEPRDFLSLFTQCIHFFGGINTASRLMQTTKTSVLSSNLSKRYQQTISAIPQPKHRAQIKLVQRYLTRCLEAKHISSAYPELLALEELRLDDGFWNSVFLCFNAKLYALGVYWISLLIEQPELNNWTSGLIILKTILAVERQHKADDGSPLNFKILQNELISFFNANPGFSKLITANDLFGQHAPFMLELNPFLSISTPTITTIAELLCLAKFEYSDSKYNFYRFFIILLNHIPNVIPHITFAMLTPEIGVETTAGILDTVNFSDFLQPRLLPFLQQISENPTSLSGITAQVLLQTNVLLNLIASPEAFKLFCKIFESNAKLAGEVVAQNPAGQKLANYLQIDPKRLVDLLALSNQTPMQDLIKIISAAHYETDCKNNASFLTLTTPTSLCCLQVIATKGYFILVKFLMGWALYQLNIINVITLFKDLDLLCLEMLNHSPPLLRHFAKVITLDLLTDTAITLPFTTDYAYNLPNKCDGNFLQLPLIKLMQIPGGILFLNSVLQTNTTLLPMLRDWIAAGLKRHTQKAMLTNILNDLTKSAEGLQLLNLLRIRITSKRPANEQPPEANPEEARPDKAPRLQP